MSKFQGRRDRSGDWQWEPGPAAAALRPYSAPLIIGALLALFMLAYVLAGHGWSFNTVLPNSCVSTASGDVSAQHNETCAPCVVSDGVSADTTNQDCSPCADTSGMSASHTNDCHPSCTNDTASVQWFNGETDTPTPQPSPACTPRPCEDSAGVQWFNGETDTPTPQTCQTPSPTPNCLDNPGYHASLTDPTVPNSSKTFTYVVSGCNDPQLQFVKLSGCWNGDEIDKVTTDPAGKGLELQDDGTIKVSGLSDADLPLTIVITFTSEHGSDDNHTDIWVWTGPGDSDGVTIWTGGPVCNHDTPTPNPCEGLASVQWFGGETDTPSPTPNCETATPSPSPTPSPTPPVTNSPTPPVTNSPTPPVTNSPTPPVTNSPSPTPTPTHTPTATSVTPSPTPVTPSPTPVTPSPTPNEATETPTPAPTPKTDLTLVKTDSPDPVVAGGTLTYHVTVTNVSSVDAVNVIVTDTMPAHVTPISATPGQGSCTGVVCNLGTIGAGQAVGIAYVVTVDADAPELLTNLACVATDTPEKDLTNNCDGEDTHVLRASVTPTAIPESATPKAMPNTGGLPGTGSPDDRLIFGLGAGLLIAGAFAATIARRRQTSSG